MLDCGLATGVCPWWDYKMQHVLLCCAVLCCGMLSLWPSVPDVTICVHHCVSWLLQGLEFEDVLVSPEAVHIIHACDACNVLLCRP